jgi:glutathione S-transferase
MYSLYNVRRWGSLAPHLVLEELEVPYQNIWMTPETVRDPAFRDLSPLGLIPVLRLDDGRTVMESAAIVTFLGDAHPGARLPA